VVVGAQGAAPCRNSTGGEERNIVDGTRCAAFPDDIGIKNGRIAKIGRILPHDAGQGDAKPTGDRRPRIHRPSTPTTTRQIFWDPYLTISGLARRHSVVTANCGFGFAPVRKQDAEARDADDVLDRGDRLRRCGRR